LNKKKTTLVVCADGVSLRSAVEKKPKGGGAPQKRQQGIEEEKGTPLGSKSRSSVVTPERKKRKLARGGAEEGRINRTFRKGTISLRCLTVPGSSKKQKEKPNLCAKEE